MLGGYYLGQLYLGISGLPSAGILSVVPSSHQLSSDNINLTQKHLLVVNSSGHTLSSENITLIQKHVLSVDNALHTHLGDNASITSEHFLGIDDSYHGVFSTEIQLTQKHTLVVENTTHSSSSDNLDLVEHKTLVVDSSIHGHTSEHVTISVRSFLDVANALHSHSAGNLTLTQKHTLSIADAIHSLPTESLGGLINLQPYGMGGGFGAVDGWGVAEFGSINIELPLNFLIIAEDAIHNLLSDELDTFIQIFNMIRTGDYIKDFEKQGEVGSEYTKDAGTMPTKHGYLGQIAPVTDENNGFLMVDMGSYGSYDEKSKYIGVISNRNSSQGIFTTDEEDTGNYIKIK